MKPQKHEVLMAVTDLDRITGEAIALTIQKSLNELKINLADCRGQAYNTTGSMSSDKKGVQAHIQKIAPDAEYQGCCLHSLTLFSMGGIMAPYSFFLISPERLELRPSNFLTFSFYLLAIRKI